MNASSDAGRLDDMLEMLEDIRRQMRIGWEGFSRDPNVQKVIAYDLMILGEAASKVSRATQRANPKVPWSEMVNLRNELIHEYGRLDLKSTWQYVQHRLARLEQRVRRARAARPAVQDH
jgi:uncharacterized protein with HEPN domain